ncbi:NB-ARC domain-containing protein [Streptomyces anulatus]
MALVTGQPGLGKTAFAVRAAREALGLLLHACGITGDAVPQDSERRADLFRTLAGDRRMLLLLDDAADEEQVRPLLPAADPSLTLVTSRNTLARLQGAHRIDLSLQRREESIALLTRVISPERVAAEAQAARDLTDLCGQLPLAVRIAAQRLAARPQEQLANLAAQLADEGRRLDALQAGDLQVRAAFGLPQRRLDPSSRRLLRRATMAAGTDFSPQTAALLAGMMLRQAQRCAEELTGRGLLPDPAADPERAPDRDPDPAAAPRGTEGARAGLETERTQSGSSGRRCSAAQRPPP